MSPDHWFEDLADHLGATYLRYSFTKGTEQEVGFLVEALGLEPGMRVLDVGCGPGRHAHALGRRGLEVHGVDISQRFVEVARQDAPQGVTFSREDARDLGFDAEFDAAISLCQGAFGLQGGPAGRVAVSAFSSYFQVRHLGDSTFDAGAGVAHERTVIKDDTGAEVETDLWTTCFTPRELRLLARGAGLEPEHVWSVEPGRYAARPPDLEHPEHLLVARRR